MMHIVWFYIIRIIHCIYVQLTKYIIICLSVDLTIIISFLQLLDNVEISYLIDAHFYYAYVVTLILIQLVHAYVAFCTCQS